MMTEAVDEIGPERFAVEIFSVRVDVVVGNLLNAFVTLAAKVHTGLEGRKRGVLRAKYDFVDLALPRRKPAVGGYGVPDGRGATCELRADVQDDDIALLDLARSPGLFEWRRVRAGTPD